MPSTLSVRRAEFRGHMIGQTKSVRPDSLSRLRRVFKRAEKSDGRPKVEGWRQFAQAYASSRGDEGLRQLTQDPPHPIASGPALAPLALLRDLQAEVARCQESTHEIRRRVSALADGRQASLLSIVEQTQRLENRQDIGALLETTIAATKALIDDPAAAAHKNDLSQLLRDLTQQSLLTAYPGLSNAARPFSSARLREGMKQAYGLMADPEDRNALRHDFRELAKMLRQANQGAAVLTWENGETTDLTGLKSEIESYVETWTWFAQADSLDGAATAVVAALRGLVDHVGARTAFESTSERLLVLLDASLTNEAAAAADLAPAFLERLTAVQKGAGAKPFPVLDALRACSVAIPFLERSGESPNIAENARAAEGLAALFDDLLNSDTPSEILTGYSPRLDSALLDVKKTAAERRALAFRNAERSRGMWDGESDDATIGRAHAATAARHELTKANRLLESLLITDRRSWSAPWRRRERQATLGRGGAASILKNKQFLNALRKRGGDTAGRDVALLLARISMLERDTLLLEQHVFGWRPSLKLDQSFAPNQEDGPLTHVGISSADLDEMGLTKGDQTVLEAEVIRLGDQGLLSVKDVVAVSRTINEAMKSLLKTRTTHHAIVDVAPTSSPVAARLIFEEFAHALAPAASAATPLDADLAAQISGRVREAEAGIAQNDSAPQAKPDDDFALSAETYHSAGLHILNAVRSRLDLDVKVHERRDRLAGNAEAYRLDPSQTRDLASAWTIKRALQAHQTEADQQDSIRALESLKRKGSLQELIDATLSLLKANTDITAIQQTEKSAIQQIVDDIVFLEETAPLLGRFEDETIDRLGERMDRSLAERGETNPGLVTFARRLIRMAILANWPARGDAAEAGYPASDYQKIKTTLQAWGLDVELFGPEIDSEACRPVSESLLKDWRVDLKGFARIDPVAEGTTPQKAKQPSPAQGRQELKNQAQAAIRSLVDELKNTEKVNLSSDFRVTGDTSRIIVDPSGLGYVRARLSAAKITQCLVEHCGDCYKLDLRLAKDCKLNFDGGLHLDLGEFGSFTTSAGVEGSGTLGRGVQLVFDVTDEGREALNGLLGKLIAGQVVTTSDWASASAASRLSDSVIKGGSERASPPLGILYSPERTGRGPERRLDRLGHRRGDAHKRAQP